MSSARIALSRSARPVAATASFVIWGWLDRLLVRQRPIVAAPFLRAGVRGVAVAPLVALGAAAWVVILRRVSAPLPLPAAVDSAAGHRETLTSSPSRIRPGCSTSARTPKSACLPSRRPR